MSDMIEGPSPTETRTLDGTDDNKKPGVIRRVFWDRVPKDSTPLAWDECLGHLSEPMLFVFVDQSDLKNAVDVRPDDHAL
jgi:hypothetical protein